MNRPPRAAHAVEHAACCRPSADAVVELLAGDGELRPGRGYRGSKAAIRVLRVIIRLGAMWRRTFVQRAGPAPPSGLAHSAQDARPPAAAARLHPHRLRLVHLPPHGAGPQGLGRRRAPGVLPAVPGAAVQLHPAPPAAPAPPPVASPHHQGVAVLGCGTLPYLHSDGPAWTTTPRARRSISFRFNSCRWRWPSGWPGIQGVAWTALLVALCVPLFNMGAMWPLARHGGAASGASWRRTRSSSSTGGRAAVQPAGLQAFRSGDHHAHAHRQRWPLPLGLMAPASGMQFGGACAGRCWPHRCLCSATPCCPLVGSGFVAAVPATRCRPVLMSFSALPTASSAYVLAARMGPGGNARMSRAGHLSTLLGVMESAAGTGVLR